MFPQNLENKTKRVKPTVDSTLSIYFKSPMPMKTLNFTKKEVDPPLSFRELETIEKYFSLKAGKRLFPLSD